MGSRPEGGLSEDQPKRLAQTLNQIGRETIAFGVRVAPHPHIWGPMERGHELRTVLALTYPAHFSRSQWREDRPCAWGPLQSVRIMDRVTPFLLSTIS
jgi:hypothetical protein